MNVLLVALHPTLALLNVNNVHEYVIFPLVNAFVAIHTASVHVNTILHVAFAFTYVTLGVHHVQLGFVLSIFSILLLPLYAVFHTLSTALKHTYVLLLASVLNVNVVHAVYSFVAVLHVALVHVL